MTERSAPAASASGRGTPARRTAVRAAATGTLAAALLGLAPQHALAAAPAPPPAPAAPAVSEARAAATAPDTLTTLSRFFARDGAVAAAKARPRIEGRTVPVYVLSPDFVRGEAGAPVARLEFLASTAVSADGQKASVWTARSRGAWKVVNIATGDDEARYSAAADGGTVFREPQINAWYEQRGDRVRPLDAEARKAIGAGGTTVAAYQKRVAEAYGDKLPGSAYDRRGAAGGYGPQDGAEGAAAAARPQPVAAGAAADGGSGPVTAASAVAGTAALLALGLSGAAALRRRHSR
ncbi:hypothetical protein CP973_11875 [Streptomyces albofaciens JCM 4342]|uniref:hypothetical protein n=1 Tax=Streptomyces albofaciens TaxID=66866 RepID=UPI001238A5F5|nr:hypothetical protein [Streptomyces albofaciens]KAA6222535.1 hypothetical protein CP973_11875 [Streptomyces albofaciens JCM 4342]